MHIKITSVAAEDIGPVLGRIAVAMEDALNPLFEQKSYGDIDQFMAVVVAVDSDIAENSRFVAAYNKIASFKHPVSLLRFKSISLSLPFDPVYIKSLTESQIRHRLCMVLCEKLGDPGLKISKKFDYKGFVADLRIALAIYSTEEQ
jgi:hypothetical protein